MIYPPTKVFFIKLISFSPTVKNIDNQKRIQNFNWELKGLNSQNNNLKNLEGKIIFISFWATWCAPCVAEMPSINKLYKDYKDKVQFLLVTNENWKTVSKFYNKNEYDFPTYNQQTLAPKELKSKTIPATFIISKDKKIIVDKKGPANWNSSTIREVLDTLLID